MRCRRRRGAGAVERGGLENRCAFTGTQGSNPCLSASRSAVAAAPDRKLKLPNSRQWRRATERRAAVTTCGTAVLKPPCELVDRLAPFRLRPQDKMNLILGQAGRVEVRIELRKHLLWDNGKSRVECVARKGWARAHAINWTLKLWRFPKTHSLYPQTIHLSWRSGGGSTTFRAQPTCLC